MKVFLRRLLLCSLILSWIGGLSAWAADFDILHAAPDYSQQADLTSSDCFNPADHCEHGMAHWVGLPAQGTAILWAPITSLALSQRENLATLALPPEPQPPRL